MMSIIETKEDEISAARVITEGIMEVIGFSKYYAFLTTKQISVSYLNLAVILNYRDNIIC